MEINHDKLNVFMGKMLGEVGAAMNASLMLIGDKLGLYKTLAAKGPLSSAELAQATNTSERLSSFPTNKTFYWKWPTTYSTKISRLGQ